MATDAGLYTDLTRGTAVSPVLRRAAGHTVLFLVPSVYPWAVARQARMHDHGLSAAVCYLYSAGSAVVIRNKYRCEGNKIEAQRKQA